MSFEEPLPEDDGPRIETYEELDDEDQARRQYEDLMKAALRCNFDREDDRLKFEKECWQGFGFKSR